MHQSWTVYPFAESYIGPLLKESKSGARAYYIRQCLHNWPTDQCLTILTELRKAMKRGYSKLFVHELIVPDREAST